MAGDTDKTRRDSGISRDVANSIRPKTRPNFSRIGKAIRGRRGRVGRGKNGRLQGDTGSDYYDGNEDDGVNPWDEDYQEAMDALRQAEQGGNAGNDRLRRYLDGDDSDDDSGGNSDGGGSGDGDLDGSGDGNSSSSLDETGKEGLDGTEENGGSGSDGSEGGDGDSSDGDSGKKTKSDDEDAGEDRRDAAANELNNAEEAEAKRGGSHDQNAAEGEQVGHTSNVKGKGKDGGKGKAKGKDKGKGKSRFRGAKKSPIVTILISLLLSFGGMMLSQAALPFTAQDKINEDVDVINTSTVQRTVVFMRTIQDTIRYSQLPVNIDKPEQHRIRTGSNIFGNEVFLPSLRMRRNLKKQGITIPRFGKNRGNMVFTDGNGITKVITPAQYQQEYENNKHFRAAVDEGSKRWKFSISAFRDKIFKFLLDKLRLNKLPFVGYLANQDKDGKKARQQSSENAQEATTWRNDTKFVEGGGEKDSRGNAKVSKTAGKISGSLANVSARISKIAGKVGTFLSISCAISGFLNNIRQMLVSFAQSPIGLLAMDFLSGVDQARAGDSDSSPINALGRNLVEEQWTEYLDYDGFEETDEDEDGIGYSFVDSAKMDGKDVKFKVTYQKRSAAQSQAFVNAFNEETVITRPDKGTERFNPSTAINAALKKAQNYLDDQPGLMASMASTAVSLLSGDDSSMLMSVMNTIGVTDYKRCTQFQEAVDYATMAADLLTIGSITADIVSVIFAPEFSWAALGSTVVTIGLREAWSLVKRELAKLIQDLVQDLIASVTPKITEFFKSFIATEAFGQDLGTSIASGAQMINGKNAQAGGMLLTSPSGYQSELDARDKINAERAKSERLARSPFDYTSQYTFAGSLASAIIPVTLQSESIFGTFTNFGNLITKSIASLAPRTSAISNMVNSQKVKDIEEYNNKYCKELAHMNALGDAYCNPIFTTDLDTLNSKIEIKGNENEYGELGYDPIDDDYNSAFRVMERVALTGSFEELTGDDLFAIRDYMAKRDQGKLTMQDKINGNPLHHIENPTIAENSDLANFIQYCGNRQSVFGAIDGNIAGDFQDDIGRLSYIPLYGSIADIGNQNAVQENFDYIQGSACHMKNNPSTKLTVKRSWNKDMYDNKDNKWPGFKNYVDTYIKDKPMTYEILRDFSRYLEDQRYSESAGWTEKSAGTAYMAKYYEENPLDTSLYGTIARISGLTKQQVEDTFEYMAFLEFQDEYDPSEYAPVLVAKEEEPTYTLEEDQIVEDAATVAIIYLNVLERGEDARERNFATA